MSFALSAIVLLAAFGVCDWSGRTLAAHYQDRWEVAATLAVGVCLFGAIGLMDHVRDTTGAWLEGMLALAMATGLLRGYSRSPDTR